MDTSIFKMEDMIRTVAPDRVYLRDVKWGNYPRGVETVRAVGEVTDEPMAVVRNAHNLYWRKHDDEEHAAEMRRLRVTYHTELTDLIDRGEVKEVLRHIVDHLFEVK